MAKIPWYEMFAVNLLLISPTHLGRKWTSSENPDDWAKELAALPLTEKAIDAALLRMKNLSAVRGQAKLVADALKKSAYAGSEPHPAFADASAIIKAMQALDEAAAAEKFPVVELPV